MSIAGRSRFTLIVGCTAFALLASTVHTQNGVQGRGQNPAPAVGAVPARPMPNAGILDPVRFYLPDPNPTVVKGFGPLPDGRMWGSTPGVAVDRDGNVYGAEEPISRPAAGGGLTKYVKR